jgi:hypothetical protein
MLKLAMVTLPLSTGLLVVLGMATWSMVAGTPEGDQLEAVFHAVLVAPVHVREVWASAPCGAITSAQLTIRNGRSSFLMVLGFR